MFFSKIQPVCHSDANGIKLGINQKVTDKHAAEYSKTILGCKLICVRCIKCSYNSIARSILEKIAILVCTGKFSYK